MFQKIWLADEVLLDFGVIRPLCRCDHAERSAVWVEVVEPADVESLVRELGGQLAPCQGYRRARVSLVGLLFGSRLDGKPSEPVTTAEATHALAGGAQLGHKEPHPMVGYKKSRSRYRTGPRKPRAAHLGSTRTINVQWRFRRKSLKSQSGREDSNL